MLCVFLSLEPRLSIKYLFFVSITINKKKHADSLYLKSIRKQPGNKYWFIPVSAVHHRCTAMGEGS